MKEVLVGKIIEKMVEEGFRLKELVEEELVKAQTSQKPGGKEVDAELIVSQLLKEGTELFRGISAFTEAFAQENAKSEEAPASPSSSAKRATYEEDTVKTGNKSESELMAVVEQLMGSGYEVYRQEQESFLVRIEGKSVAVISSYEGNILIQDANPSLMANILKATQITAPLKGQMVQQIQGDVHNKTVQKTAQALADAIEVEQLAVKSYEKHMEELKALGFVIQLLVAPSNGVH